LIGRIKELVYEGEYVVIRQSLLSKLVVLVKAIAGADDGRLVIPRTTESNIDDAPKVDSKQPLSENDMSRLEHFYMAHAA
jgi:hypothetical protein